MTARGGTGTNNMEQITNNPTGTTKKDKEAGGAFATAEMLLCSVLSCFGVFWSQAQQYRQGGNVFFCFVI